MSKMVLIDAYEAYLKTLDKASGSLLQLELQESQFYREAFALNQFLVNGSCLMRSSIFWENSPWDGRSCYIDSNVPSENIECGDLWFDPIEVSFSVCVKGNPNRIHGQVWWLAINPVSNWQFCTFLRLSIKGPDTDLPKDFLSPARFDGRCRFDFTTDIYQEEAFVYAQWFGKTLSSAMKYAEASKVFTDRQMQSLFPKQIKLWDCSFDIEGFRIAFGLDQIHKLSDVARQIRNMDTTYEQDRMVYYDHEKDIRIGFTTSVSPSRREKRVWGV